MTVQLILMHLMRDQSWTILLLTAYCIGGVINHSLMLGKCYILQAVAKAFLL